MPFIGGWVGYTLGSIQAIIPTVKLTETLPTKTLTPLTTIESGETVNDGDVEIAFSDGKKKIIAFAKKSENVANYYEIESYNKVYISPNRKFAALQGIGFEESFVHIYNVEKDRLEDKIYGVVSDWDNTGRLGIVSCNLAGEECISYISTSPETPWVLQEVPL
jgi:hypothetical protein